VIETRDASGDQIRENVAYEDIDERDLFPVTGQLEIESVERGDLLSIDVERIDAGPIGHCWTRPGIGLGRPDSYVVRRIEQDNPSLILNDQLVPLQIQPHVGTLGLAPRTPFAARDLGRHGGNLDTKRLGEGSSLILQAEQRGGGLYVGDVHLGIGDGEVCGTGVEVPACVTLRVRRIVGYPAPLPLVVENGQSWAIGIGSTVEDALRKAVNYATDRVALLYRVPADEAYLTVAQLLKLDICQVVNPHVSLALSLHAGLDRALHPSALGSEEASRDE
jgi:amidase